MAVRIGDRRSTSYGAGETLVRKGHLAMWGSVWLGCIALAGCAGEEDDSECTASCEGEDSRAANSGESDKTGSDDPPIAIDVSALCASYCGTTGALACGEAADECVLKCEFEGSLIPEQCNASYQANMECQSTSVSNFACDEAGVAVLEPGVCLDEQSAIASCTLQESGASEVAADACASGCVKGELTPPISCGYTPDVLGCATSCWTTFLIISDECALLFLEQTACEVASGPEHWACVDGVDNPQFDDSACTSEAAAFQACVQG